MKMSHLNSRTGFRTLLALMLGGALVQAATAASYEWGFNGNLNPAYGNGTLTYGDAASSSGTTFGTTDGGTVPHINGQAATFMRVPAFSATASGFNGTFNDTGPNGGGAYVNQYTFIFDILSPASVSWTPFFNTAPDNGNGSNNDADLYIASDGSVGIGGIGYSSAGLITPDTWHRVVFAADLGAGNVTIYLDGAAVVTRTGGSLLEGRHSLYSNADAGPDVRFFNEGDIGGQYTHEVLVSALYFSDRTWNSSEIGALGGPNAAGIVAVPEPGTWALLGLGAVVSAWSMRRRKA